jgi:hypothetical protein
VGEERRGAGSLAKVDRGGAVGLGLVVPTEDAGHAGQGVAELYDDFVAELRPLRGTWATWTSEVATWLVDHVLGLLDLAFGDRELGEEELRTAIAAYRRGGVRGRLVHAPRRPGGHDRRRGGPYGGALALADELAM